MVVVLRILLLLFFVFPSLSFADGGKEFVSGEACLAEDNTNNIGSLRAGAIAEAQRFAVENMDKLKSLRPIVEEDSFNSVVTDISKKYIHSLMLTTNQEHEHSVCVKVSGDVSYSDIEEILKTVKYKKSANTVKIYVSPTEFFNGSKSKALADKVKDFFVSSPYIEITEDNSKADYIISSNIVKAKITPINGDVNRLNMMVNIKSTVVQGGFSAVETSNKFTTFKNTDNEQKVVSDFAVELFKTSAEEIRSRIERPLINN